jgi:MOSC domain-containing protein YiiM
MDGIWMSAHDVQEESTVEPLGLRRVISAASVRAAATHLLKIVRMNRPFANVPEPEIRLPQQNSVPNGAVVAVSIDGRHRFSKISRPSITLTSGHGIEGDAHYGPFVRHQYLARRNPKAPNLRQVHLIPSELFDALRTSGFEVRPGDLGENIATVGLDLEYLPVGTLLRLGASATLELTGVRTPCVLIDRFKSGLKNRLQDKPAEPRFKAGVMAIVTEGGEVSPGDRILAVLPAPPHLDLPPL